MLKNLFSKANIMNLKALLLDLLVAVLILFIGINLKGLYHYLMHSSDYVVTYKLEDYWPYLSNMAERRINLFAAIAAIISSFISLAFPLSINQVANSLKEYNDKEITRMFFNEPVFIKMRSVLFLLFLSLGIWYFVNDPLKVGILLMSLLLLTLYYFYLFFNRVLEYITSADDIVQEFYRQRTRNLLDP
jgi:hypothetical protein